MVLVTQVAAFAINLTPGMSVRVSCHVVPSLALATLALLLLLTLTLLALLAALALAAALTLLLLLALTLSTTATRITLDGVMVFAIQTANVQVPAFVSDGIGYVECQCANMTCCVTSCLWCIVGFFFSEFCEIEPQVFPQQFRASFRPFAAYRAPLGV